VGLPPFQRGNSIDPRAVPFIDAFGRRYGTPVREIGPYFCCLPLKFDATEENLVPGPAAARFSPHAKYASAFQSYADAFVDSMRWDASWDLSQSRNVFGLFANVSGDSVGFVQEYFRLDPERYREQTPGLRAGCSRCPLSVSRESLALRDVREVMSALLSHDAAAWSPTVVNVGRKRWRRPGKVVIKRGCRQLSCSRARRRPIYGGPQRCFRPRNPCTWRPARRCTHSWTQHSVSR
jgi:hypothetical protein